jgi:hypothetical protein
LKQGHVAVPLLSGLGPHGKLLIVKQADGIDCPALVHKRLRHCHVLQILDAIVQGIAIHVADKSLRRYLPNYGTKSGSTTILHGGVVLSYLQHLKDLVLALFCFEPLEQSGLSFFSLCHWTS